MFDGPVAEVRQRREAEGERDEEVYQRDGRRDVRAEIELFKHINGASRIVSVVERVVEGRMEYNENEGGKQGCKDASTRSRVMLSQKC